METGSEVYMSELLVRRLTFTFDRLDLTWKALMRPKSRMRKICWSWETRSGISISK
jgi:hypothetical protein